MARQYTHSTSTGGKWERERRAWPPAGSYADHAIHIEWIMNRHIAHSNLTAPTPQAYTQNFTVTQVHNSKPIMYQRETHRERDNRAADGWHAALIHLNLHILYRQFLFLCTQPKRRGRSALIPFIRSSVTRRFDSTRQSNLIEIQ